MTQPDTQTLLLDAAQQLSDAGVVTAVEDAAALAAHALGLPDPADLDRAGSLGMAQPAFEELVEQRSRHVPMAHLLGGATFRGITLEVGPGVFTPQPETSSVVQWAVDALQDRPHPVVADLCTGSGTIAFALAHEVPNATVHAVERDAGALQWAYRNAESRVLAGDPLVLLHHDGAEDCLPELDGRLDLVASNPPYVGTSETHIPAREVLDHDPSIALWAGDDGLDVIRLVERSAARLLKDGGLVVIEHSDRQGRSAPALLEQSGDWDDVADHVDHDGLDRFVTARRKPRTHKP
jgi:release factor glutamine methyltransferase